MKDILIEIDRIVADELERANKVHPLFHSDHEGESVIREEIEEAIDSFETIGTYYNNLWEAIKKNSAIDAIENVNYIKLYAEYAAAELIQVVAMCDKFISSQEARNGN